MNYTQSKNKNSQIKAARGKSFYKTLAQAIFCLAVFVVAPQLLFAATKIVYSGPYNTGIAAERGIWTMNADGTNRTHVTTGNDIEPDFSPDGGKIVFVDLSAGSISVVNADGMNRAPLFYGTNGNVRKPTFSPDGTKILFTNTISGTRILVMNADGSHAHEIVSDNIGYGGSNDPSWSPDGTKIAYWADYNYNQNFQTPTLYVVNADGTNKMRYQFNPYVKDFFPSWSPDGTKLIFIRETFNNGVTTDTITTLNLSDGTFSSLGVTADYDSRPNYSKDGAKIVFQKKFPISGNQTVTNIVKMDANGTNQMRLDSSLNENFPRFYTPAPTAVAAPADLQALFAGEGNARDSVGANDGTLQNGATFAIGKVGQAFNFDGVDDYVSVPSSSTLNITGDITIEGWIYPTGDNVQRIVSKFDGTSGTYVLGLSSASTNGSRGLLFYGTDANGSPFTVQSTTVAVQNNQWNYIAFTWSSSGLGFYVNGTSQIASDIPVKNRIATTAPLIIGATIGTENSIIGAFNGKIDELSLYNRALSTSEVQTIYEAGKLGKIKQQSFTAQMTVQLAAATINFPSGQSGTAQEYAIDGAGLPSIPSGTPKLYYEVEAGGGAATGDATVCFDVSSLSADFANLRIYHLENGAWVARTALSNTSPNLCTSALPSFSPFAIVQFAPSAAGVSIEGRVQTADGRGIRNALVTLTTTDGTVRSVRTGAFGRYQFKDVEIGQTVFVGVAAKQFVFNPDILVINLQDNVIGADFTADGAARFYFER